MAVRIKASPKRRTDLNASIQPVRNHRYRLKAVQIS